MKESQFHVANFFDASWIVVLLAGQGGGRGKQSPRFSIRMIIWIFCSDTETGAVTPLGRGAETLTALKILLLSLIADVKQS